MPKYAVRRRLNGNGAIEWLWVRRNGDDGRHSATSELRLLTLKSLHCYRDRDVPMSFAATCDAGANKCL